ncbi:MAG: low temperature requirement protein A [Spirochaetota bacterium]
MKNQHHSSQLLRKMTPRSPHESHRVATPLELLYDLVFVVAIAFATETLHHGILEHHIADSITTYLLSFFSIWWAWVQFTSFASSYDNDDLIYRIAVIFQMLGALIIAASIKMNSLPMLFTGYMLIRFIGILLWLRVAVDSPKDKPMATRFIKAIGLCQLGWAIIVFMPRLGLPGYLFMITCELLAPLYCKRKQEETYWHPKHIAERYGLMTIIVLGESVLSITVALKHLAEQVAVKQLNPELPALIAASILLLFSIWWLYFLDEREELLTSQKRAFQWGYTHFFIFASIGAVGAGINIATDTLVTSHTPNPLLANASLAIASILYLASIWLCHQRLHKQPNTLIWLFAACLIGVSIWLPYGPLCMAVIFVLLLAYEIKCRSTGVVSLSTLSETGD